MQNHFYDIRLYFEKSYATKKESIRLLLFLSISLTFTACNWGWKKHPPPSGYYGNHLLMAYDPNGGIITGMYVDNLEDSIPNPDCSFYFTAKFYGKKNNIIYWLPGQRFKDDKYAVMEMLDEKSFRFTSERNFRACPQIPDFQSGKILQLRSPQNWRYIRTVRTENAIVHASPSKEAPAVGYVQRDVILKVIRQEGFWLEIIAGREDKLRGWVFNKNLKRFPS